MLGFSGGSRFRVEIGLGLGTWRLQAPNPHQGSGLPEGLSQGTRDGAGQDPLLATKTTHLDKPLVVEAFGILSGAAAGPGKRHGELPHSFQSQPALLLDPRHVMLSDVGIGSP